MMRPLQLLLALIAACAVLYLRLFVPGPGNGADFADFYAGAWAEAHGLNPFSDAQLWQAERILFYGGASYHGPIQLYTYKNPPPFALLLRPLTGLSQSDAYWIWAAAILTAGLGAALLFLHEWPRRPRLIGALAVACCPAALWGYRVGQVSAFLALGLGLAAWLNARNHPLLAGLALTLGFMKPHLMLPIAAVFVLSVPATRRLRMVLGTLAGLAAWAALTLAFDGGAGRIRDWVTQLRGDTTLFAGQADVAALPGLLYRAVPAGYDGAITLCAALCALILVAYFVYADGPARDDEPSALALRTLGGGICACLCFLPYEHTSDQIVLALLLLPLIGPSGRGLAHPSVLIAAFVATLAPLALFHDHRTPVFDVLPPLSLLVAYWLLPSGYNPRFQAYASHTRLATPSAQELASR